VLPCLRRSHLLTGVFSVASYGKIIIQERCLPVSDKTIKPVDLGGLAGGEKYICQGILEFTIVSIIILNSKYDRDFIQICCGSIQLIW
jgi:hypothetical protein